MNKATAIKKTEEALKLLDTVNDLMAAVQIFRASQGVDTDPDVGHEIDEARAYVVDVHQRLMIMGQSQT